MWPIQLAFPRFVVCRIFLSSLTICNTSHFSHDRSKWYSLCYPSTTFQYFLGISDLLSKVYIVLTPSLLTPWSRFLFEKLPGLQLVKKFPAFYGTQMFITTFTSACHLSLFWASSGHTKVTIQIWGKCSCFVTQPDISVRSCQHLAQLPSWSTTTCLLSVAAYSVYLQLPSILEAIPPSAAWGLTMPW